MHEKTFYSLIALLGLLSVSCGPTASAAEHPNATPVVFMAVDTSGSAESSHGKFFRQAADLILSCPSQSTLMLYRFDSSPAEVYSDRMPASRESAAALLKRTLQHTSRTEGTNLAKLFRLWEKAKARSHSPMRLVVFTDCGTEKMTGAEIGEASRIAKAWIADKSVLSLQFVGVADGHREQLRDMIPDPGDKFEILDQPHGY